MKLSITCHYSFYTVASKTSDTASNEDSHCRTPVTLSDINTASLLKAEWYLWKGILLAVCWDLRCSSKAVLGTMFSASFTIPVHPAATPEPSTQWELCPALRSLRGQAQPLQLGQSYKGLWIALVMVVSPWSHICSQSVRWYGTEAEPGTDSNGKWSQWALETDWLYLIWEKAKPAVIGQCRGTAVLLISCIKIYIWKLIGV